MNKDKDELLEKFKDYKSALNILTKVRGNGKLWHRTSVNSLKGIFNTGSIQPNDGRFKVTYPQSNNCLSRELKAISLFDFNSNSLEKILDQAMNWECFIKDQKYATVLICIDPNFLLSEKIKKTWEIPTNFKPHIPWVEVCYCGEIPVSAFSEFLVVKKKPGFEFIQIPLNDKSFSTIEDIYRTWAEEYESEKAALIAKKDTLTMEDYFANPTLYSLLFDEEEE